MKKLISFFLSIVMLVSVVASVDLSAYAAETNDVDQNSVGYSLHSSEYYNEHFNFDMPSYARDFHNILTENELFMGKVVVWETAHIVTSPGHLLDSGAITLEEYYKTVLFDLIAQTDSENGLKKLLSYATNKEASYIVSLTKTITKPLEENSLAPETLNKLSTKEAAKLVTDSPLYNTASAISTVTKILSWAKDSVELVEAFSKHLAVADMKDGTEEFLRAIANDTRNPIELRNAANDCISYFGDGYEKVLNQICAGTWDIAVGVFDTVADVALDWAWGLIVSALVGPAGSAALLGIKGARVLSNYLFSTDKEIEEYYKITAECIIEIAIRNILNDMNSQKEFLTDFYASQLYMCTIDMFKKTILLGFDYSIDFLNVCADSNLETSIVPWQRNECLELIEEIKGVKELKESNFDGYERNCLYEYKIKYCSDFDSVLNGVQNQNIPIEKITLTQIKEFEAGIDFGLIGDYITIEYYPSAYTETVKEQWSSSNEDIIQVTEDSTLFSTNKPGSCKLTCTLSNGISSSIDVVVGKGDEINTEENIANYKYSINDDSVIITSYIGNSPNAMIPSKIQGLPVTRIVNYAFQYCTSLTSVTIPNSVTSIGNRAFQYCTSLTSVTIGESVTSIGEYAFDGCTKLNKVNISSIESWCKISFSDSNSNPLYYSKKLYLNDELVTDLIIPNSVTSIGGYAFSDCTSLTSVTIPNSVISVGYSAFSYCTSLTSVTIPNSVTSIGSGAFDNCTSLTSVTIPNSVTSIDSGAFYECTSLTSVTIGNSVTSIGYQAFLNCSSLTSVTIPNSVTSIRSSAFGCCTSLTSVTIPNSVTSIRDRAFENCTSLTSVTIPDSVKSIGDSAFYDCTSLSTIYILNKYCDIYKDYDTIPTSTTIYGFNRSTAQSYANSYSKKFEIINNCNDFGFEHSESYSQNTNVVSSTCTESGSYDVENRCNNCNTVIYCETFISEPLGHSFTNYVSNEDATCTENGTKTAKCDRCDETDTITQEALGHEYTETEYIAPTSTSNGKIVYTCIRCEDSYTEIIPALGGEHTHSWSEWTYNGDAVYFSATEYKNGTATRTCSVCGESETKTIEGTGLLRARTATAKFESELKMCIATRTEQVNQFKEVYCVFTREDGVSITVPASKSYVITSSTTSNTYFDFGVTPQGLNSPVVIRFYGITNDDITVWGDDYTYVMTTNYILKQLRNSASSETLKNLFVEMLYYGYENQIYSNWDLEHPLTDLLTEQEKARHTTAPLTLNKYQKVDYVECANPETTWRSVSLVLGAATKIRYRTRAMTLSDDLKAVVEVAGEAEPYTYYYNDPEDAECFAEDGEGGIYFTFPDLAVKRLRSKVYVTLYKGDTPIINTFEYSAETYAYGRKEGTSEYPLTQQQMRFADAARAYFGI